MSDPTNISPEPEAPEQPKTDSGTALTATAEEDPKGFGQFPVAIRQALEMRKLANAVAGEIAKLSWGKAIERSTARAIADWGQSHHVDVITEIDFLGNKPYLNARFYLRRLAEQVSEGLVDYAVPDFIHYDARLEKLAAQVDEEGKLTMVAKDALAELDRRIGVRIQYGVPDAAAGACVFRVKLHNLSREVVGVNWCGGGTGAHKAGGKGDPVGDMEPVKTAESRAARRCLRLLVSHMPKVAQEIGQTEAALEAFSGRIAEDERKLDAPSALSDRGVHIGGYEEPRAVGGEVSTTTVHERPVRRQRVEPRD